MAKSDYDDGGAAAGQSINKTLGDIEALLKGADFSPSSRPMRKKLRECLQQALEDVSESWYKKGFNRGHREAYQAAQRTGEVPVVLRVKKKRGMLEHSNKITVKLKSTIRGD